MVLLPAILIHLYSSSIDLSFIIVAFWIFIMKVIVHENLVVLM